MHSTWSRVPGVRPCPEQHKPQLPAPQLGSVKCYFTSPGKTGRFCQKLLTPLQIPQNQVYSGWPTFGTPSAHCVQSDLGKPTTVSQRLAWQIQKKLAQHSHNSSHPKPFLHSQPNLPAAERGKHHKLVPNQPGQCLPSSHGPTKQSSLSVPGQTVP